MASSPPTGPARWLPELVLVGGALAVRAAYLAGIAETPLVDVLIGDARGYVEWGERIAAGAWLGDEVFYQAPLYPYFVGTLLALTGGELMAVRIAQVLLGAGSCLLLCRAGTHLFSRRAGLLAGGLLALYPPAVFFDGILQKTSLALFLTSGLLLCIARLDHGKRVRWPLAAGLALGLLILTRENALALLPLLALCILVPLGALSFSARLARLALIGLGLALVLVPVGLRNDFVGDAFLVTTSQLGSNLYIGNNPDANGTYLPLRSARGHVEHEREDATQLAESALGRALGPAEVSAYWTGQVAHWVREHPGDWLSLLWRKWRMVWNAREQSDSEGIEFYAEFSPALARAAPVFHFGVLAPMAMLGVWLTRRRWRELLVLYVMLAGMAVSVALFFVLARYRFPLVPILALFAGAGIASLWRQDARRVGNLALGGALSLGTALFCNLPVDVRSEPLATGYFNLGVELGALERHEEAEGYLRKALSLYDRPTIREQLARSLYRQGRNEEAARLFERTLSDTRSAAEARRLRALLVRLYDSMGRELDAERHRRRMEEARGPGSTP